MALCSARVVRGVRAGAVLGILVLVVMFIITGHNTDQLGRRSARSGLDSLHGALDETPGPGGERARRVAAADSGAAVQLAKPTRAAPPITTVPLHASVASPGAGAGREDGGGGEQNLQQALAVGADGRPPSKSSLVEALRVRYQKKLGHALTCSLTRTHKCCVLTFTLTQMLCLTLPIHWS